MSLLLQQKNTMALCVFGFAKKGYLLYILSTQDEFVFLFLLVIQPTHLIFRYSAFSI